ncbi:MAG: phage protein [Burkholderiales bacterium]|nr:phage protein [Burkholderiales bacterium]
MAKLLHVTPRTLHNWIAGRHDIPYAAFKLLRVLLRYELPGDDWHGWHFHAGKLYTPEGRFIEPSDSDWWSLLVRKSQMFTTQYARCVELEKGARGAVPAAPACVSGRGAAGAAPGPDAPASGRREAPGPNLLLTHFRKRGETIFEGTYKNRAAPAIETIAPKVTYTSQWTLTKDGSRTWG